MDFHALQRRDLQTLCKKNRIPANITNVAMADALAALTNVEGLEDFLGSLKYQSPKKPLAAAAEMPTTARRTSTRRRIVKEELSFTSTAPPSRNRRTATAAKGTPAAGELIEETNIMMDRASPLPRSRRVSIRSVDVRSLAMDEDGEVSQKEPDTPVIAAGKTPVIAAVKTPATRGRMVAVMNEEKVVASIRRTRQSSKKEAGDVAAMMSVRRSARIRAAVKMDQGEEEKDDSNGEVQIVDQEIENNRSEIDEEQDATVHMNLVPADEISSAFEELHISPSFTNGDNLVAPDDSAIVKDVKMDLASELEITYSEAIITNSEVHEDANVAKNTEIASPLTAIDDSKVNEAIKLADNPVIALEAIINNSEVIEQSKVALGEFTLLDTVTDKEAAEEMKLPSLGCNPEITSPEAITDYPEVNDENKVVTNLEITPSELSPGDAVMPETSEEPNKEVLNHTDDLVVHVDVVDPVQEQEFYRDPEILFPEEIVATEDNNSIDHEAFAKGVDGEIMKIVTPAQEFDLDLDILFQEAIVTEAEAPVSETEDDKIEDAEVAGESEATESADDVEFSFPVSATEDNKAEDVQQSPNADINAEIETVVAEMKAAEETDFSFPVPSTRQESKTANVETVVEEFENKTNFSFPVPSSTREESKIANVENVVEEFENNTDFSFPVPSTREESKIANVETVVEEFENMSLTQLKKLYKQKLEDSKHQQQ